MALDYISATDAILSAFKVPWDAESPALVGGSAPVIVYEPTESDLTPHPRVGNKPWARIVVRHNDANKVTLNNEAGTAKYRRVGLAWVQVFVPATSAEQWTLGQQLGMLAQKAFEGKRPGGVVITKATLMDRPKSGAFYVWDMRANFYWEQIR